MRKSILRLTLAAALAGGAARAETDHVEGKLADGAPYAIDRPANWNGTVLLWSHGYSFRPAGETATSPPNTRDALLAQGYALVASDYARPGWALDVAPDDQLDTLAAFTDKFGKPKRVIAWGASMGGLVTVALAERPRGAIDGALPVCGSVGGAVGMMNMALDGAFVFTTLAAPDAGLRLLNTSDDKENGAHAAAAVTAAQATPEGRARLALASALAGLPGWTDPTAPQPATTDYAAQEAEAAKSFVMGVFLPRAGMEQQAGGVFSWNNGIDYARQLDLSGRRPFVAALYTAAGLDLQADLDRLAKAPRLSAAPKAVAYMKRNYTPSGALQVPMVTLHTTGDGMTSPTLERAYGDLAEAAGKADLLRPLYIARAGHCTFSTPDYLAALHLLETRLDSGRWKAPAPDAAALFADYHPTPFLRPCNGRAACAGEPAELSR